MYYSTIEIKPNAFEDSYRVNYYDIPHDRKPSNGSLCAGLGFYHYPKEKTLAVAFEELKKAMIEKRLEIITNLNKDIEAIEKLTL